MGKNKNKRMPQPAKQNVSASSIPVSQQPVVSLETVTKPEVRIAEVVTSEEGAKYLSDAMDAAEQYDQSKRAEADAYFDERKRQADQYFDSKTVEADRLTDEATAQVTRAVEQAVSKKEKEMQGQVREAEETAQRTITDAEKEAQEKMSAIVARQVELDKNLEKYMRELAELEADKVSYKQAVLEKIQSELKIISQEKETLEVEIESLKKSIRKKDADIQALEEDKDFFTEQVNENTVKKAQLLAYQLQIEELTKNYEVLNTRYSELMNAYNNLKSQILLYGDNPSRIMEENAALTQKISELETRIGNCPSAEELEKLRVKAEQYTQLEAQIETLEREKLQLETENTSMKVNLDEIEACRKFIKILELQKAELQHELDRNIELYNKNNEKVFATLSEIDSMPVDDYPKVGIASLKVLCEKFRGYLANRSKKPLYYSEQMIRTFIAGFASSRIMILEGLSGTGKSSLPEAFQDFIGAHTEVIEVQSSWKDRNDLLGFYNDFKKQYKETEFLKALYTASHDSNNIYCIVLDEMNLSRIEYYFADLLSGLEKDQEKWLVALISDYASIKGTWPELIHQGKLQICDNTWFIGTANKDDSTFMITDKVYDRAVVLNFDKKGEPDRVTASGPIQMSNREFQTLLCAASSRFADKKDEERYRQMMKKLDDFVKEYFQITFGNRIAIQLDKFVPTYIACGGTVDEAVDIMFSRKVLRKLEGIYDESTKESLDLFRNEIINTYKYNMPVTIAAITRMMDKM